MFTNGALRSPLFIALMMMLAQQLSGINAVSSCMKFPNDFIECWFSPTHIFAAQWSYQIFQAIFFSTEIFKDAGLSTQDAQSATLGMGGMNVAMTIISLILIEKAGRKTLMLSGLGVMLISTTCLLICLLVQVKKRKLTARNWNLTVRFQVAQKWWNIIANHFRVPLPRTYPSSLLSCLWSDSLQGLGQFHGFSSTSYSSNLLGLWRPRWP